MRVIAGKARRLPLVSPEGRGTRPTTDRIKETLFNILQDDIPGCRFLDLFSGSGAIGIEAISRGAKEAVFVEFCKEALSDAKIMNPDTILILETSLDTPVDYVDTEQFEIVRIKEYKNNQHVFLRAK